MLPLLGRSDEIYTGPIRAGRTEPSTGRSPLLFWVLAGSGRVRTGSTVYEVPAGELLWIPAGARYAMETDSDSVAFPILLPPSDGVTDGPATVTRLRVPPGWEDRLIHEFVHNLGYLRGDAAKPASLFEMIARADDGSTSLPRLPHDRRKASGTPTHGCYTIFKRSDSIMSERPTASTYGNGCGASAANRSSDPCRISAS